MISFLKVAILDIPKWDINTFIVINISMEYELLSGAGFINFGKVTSVMFLTAGNNINISLFNRILLPAYLISSRYLTNTIDLIWLRDVITSMTYMISYPE